MDGQMAAPQPVPQPTPQPQQPANDPMAKLRDLLAIKLAEMGSQQETPVPRYQGGQIPPGSGLAAARNPAIMKDVLDRADTPAQAAFQQAMQQHNEIGANQKEFLQYGSGMLAAQGRQYEIDIQRQIEAARLGETVRHNQATENKLGSAINKPQLSYDAKGQLIERDPTTNTWKPAAMQGGSPILKQPSDTAVQARTAFETTKTNIQLLKDMALSQAGGLGTRAIGTLQRYASHIPGNEMFSSQANVNDYNALVNDLGTQLRAIYGAQGIRAFQEIQLLLKNIPPYASSPELVQQRFSKIDSIITQLEGERQRMQPAAFPPSSPDASNGQSPADIVQEYLNATGQR